MSSKSSVERMQNSDTEEDTDRYRSALEFKFLPNQVLLPGSGAVVSDIFDGIESATPCGIVNSWELLAQAAAATVPPTSADESVVAENRVVILSHVDFVIDSLHSERDDTVSSLQVDILDAILEFGTFPIVSKVVEALKEFGRRGEWQAARIGTIFD